MYIMDLWQYILDIVIKIVSNIYYHIASKIKKRLPILVIYDTHLSCIFLKWTHRENSARQIYVRNNNYKTKGNEMARSSVYLPESGIVREPR